MLAETVATPIEQEVNGVDNMLYITSQAVGDGTLSINVVFKPGTNVDTAQVLVQRVWLDPGTVAARNLTAGDVVAAIRAANLQVAAGAINQPPGRSPGVFQLSVQTLGRLSDAEQFGDIAIRSEPGGTGYVRVRDVARVELGSLDYTINAYLDCDVATAIIIYQRPGSNALAPPSSRRRWPRRKRICRPGWTSESSPTRPSSSSNRWTRCSKRCSGRSCSSSAW